MKYREHDDFELMSMRRMSDSLDATRMMLAEALKIAKQSQACLLNLAMEFCGREMQERQATNEDLSRIPPEELAGMLRGKFKTLKLVASDVVVQRTRENARLVVELRKELDEQRVQADRSREQIERLERQVRSLEKTLENERKARRDIPLNPPDGQDIPKISPGNENRFNIWLTHWQGSNRNHQRDTRVVLAIGKTGAFQARELENLLTQSGTASRSTAKRAILDCLQEGLLEAKTTLFTGGRPARMLTLSEKGKWLYRKLTGSDPQASEANALLAAHKSERHLSVILRIGEQFQRLGYEVDREPLRIHVEAQHFFLPDLVIRKDGETFYLEVEIGDRDRPGLEHKWANALAVGGRVCVATDSLTAMRRIQSNLAQWSGYEGVRVSLYITFLDYLKERQPGESPWYAIKNYSPG